MLIASRTVNVMDNNEDAIISQLSTSLSASKVFGRILYLATSAASCDLIDYWLCWLKTSLSTHKTSSMQPHYPRHGRSEGMSCWDTGPLTS